MPLPPSTRRIQRNLRRRRLGGVCSGIADYLEVNVTLVRAAFVLGNLVLFSATIWVYLVLWFAMPAAADAEMPDVSWSMRRKLRAISKRLAKLHRKHDEQVTGPAQEAFDAIRLLAPFFEARADAPEKALAAAALVRFPNLLDQIQALSPDDLARVSGAGAQSPAALLFEQLIQMRAAFSEASRQRIRQEFRVHGDGPAPDSASPIDSMRLQMAPLVAVLRERAGTATLTTLQAIESKLELLLERIEAGSDAMDLRPLEVRKIAFEYLPDALRQYLQLPAAMARTARLSDGRTAEEALAGQLNLLDRTLEQMTRSFFEKDASGLLIHGRFLKEKFAEQPFQLDSQAPAASPVLESSAHVFGRTPT